jgi:hypothetical protein
MFFIIIGMLLTLVLAAVVLALVAVPARRQGRDVLTPHGEELVQAARERTSEAVDAARDRVGDLAERLPLVPRGTSRGHEQDAAEPGLDRDGESGQQGPDRPADRVIDVREPRLPAHPPLP